MKRQTTSNLGTNSEIKYSLVVETVNSLFNHLNKDNPNNINQVDELLSNFFNQVPEEDRNLVLGIKNSDGQDIIEYLIHQNNIPILRHFVTKHGFLLNKALEYSATKHYFVNSGDPILAKFALDKIGHGNFNQIFDPKDGPVIHRLIKNKVSPDVISEWITYSKENKCGWELQVDSLGRSPIFHLIDLVKSQDIIDKKYFTAIFKLLNVNKTLYKNESAADINPLMYSILKANPNGNKELFKWILKLTKDDLEHKDSNGENIAHYIARDAEEVSYFQLLEHENARLIPKLFNEPSNGMVTANQLAVEPQKIELLKLIFFYNQVVPHDLFQYAVKIRSTEAVKFLSQYIDKIPADEFVKLLSELQTAEAKLTTSENQDSKQKEALTALETESSKQKAKIKELETESSAQKKTLTALENKNSKQKEELEVLESENKKILVKLSDLESSYREALRDVSRLELISKKLGTENNKHEREKKNYTELQRKFDTLKDRFDDEIPKLICVNKNQEIEIGDLKKEIGGLAYANNNQKTLIQEQKNKLSDLQFSKRTLDETIQAHKIELLKLKDTIEQHKKYLGEQKKQLDAKQNQIKEQEQKLHNQEDTINSQKQQLNELKGTINNQKQQLNEQDKSSQSKQGTLDKITEKTLNLKSLVNDFEQILSAVNKPTFTEKSNILPQPLPMDLLDINSEINAASPSDNSTTISIVGDENSFEQPH